MIDDDLSRRILITASIAGASGVLLGALGAHGLADLLAWRGVESELIPKRVDQFNVGVRYHLVHTVALLALASVPFGKAKVRRWVARLFLAGLIFFSGSLYVLVLANLPMLGAITPIGGVLWIAAWVCLFFVAYKFGRG